MRPGGTGLRALAAVVLAVLLAVLLAALLAGLLAVTLARLLQPGWGPAVRAASFAPLALPAYAALAVACLVGTARARRRPGRRAHRRAGARLAATVLLAGLGALHAAWLSPQVAGAPATVADDAPRLRVLALNVLGGAADPAAVVAQARRTRADVLVLSEVTPEALARMDAAGLAGDYPHRAGRPAEWVVGTLVASTSPLRDVERLRLEYGAWGTTVASPLGDLRLLGVHPQPPIGDARGWARDHASLLEEVRTGGADLVAGDLNATPDHRPLQGYADAGLRSASEQAGAGWSPTWPAGGLLGLGPLRLPRLVQIDHVLAGERLVVTEVRRVDVPGTDHSGVLAEVAPAPGA